MTDHRPLDGHVLHVLVIARVVNRLGAFTLPFLAVLLTTELGASLPQAGLALAAFGLATIPSRIAGGLLADRFGRRPVIAAGLVGCAVAQAGLALAPTLAWAAVAAVALGLAFEVYEPPSQAIVADVTSPAGRPAAYALLGTSIAVAGVAAGLLAALLGRWDLRLLFVADAASCLAAAILVWVALPGGSPPAAVRDAGAVPPSLWRDRALVLMVASGTVFAMVYLQLLTALPLTLAARGLRASDAGVVLATSAVTLLGGRLVLRRLRLDALEHFRALAIGHLLLGTGLAANAFAAGLPTFAAAAVVWSAGELFLLGHGPAVVAALAPDHARGRYLAAYGLSWGIAGVAAPLTGLRLLEAGPAVLWIAAGGTMAMLAFAQPALRRLCQPRLDASHMSAESAGG